MQGVNSSQGSVFFLIIMISGFAKNSFIMFKNIIKDQLLSKKCWLSIFSLNLLEIARKRNPGPEAHLWSQEQVSEDWIWSRPPHPNPSTHPWKNSLRAGGWTYRVWHRNDRGEEGWTGWNYESIGGGGRVWGTIRELSQMIIWFKHQNWMTLRIPPENTADCCFSRECWNFR